MSLFSKDEIDAASVEVERLGRELDITNADHIALWLEVNFDDDVVLSELAVRIADAHDRAVSATRAPEPLLAEVRDHIEEQVTHAKTRIADGTEMGATVWRIALEDIVRENTALLTRLDAARE